METKDIIKIVKESFNNHISSWANETILGLESGIDGKEDFLSDVEKQIEQLKKDEWNGNNI